MKIPKEQTLYIRSMGKALLVTALISGETKDERTDAANEYCRKNPDEGVVSEFHGMVFIANIYDRGIPLPRRES